MAAFLIKYFQEFLCPKRGMKGTYKTKSYLEGCPHYIRGKSTLKRGGK